MADIDYETEYDNRARVKEHPQIFARWTSDAAAYRDAMGQRARLNVSYGPSARQSYDFFPAADGHEKAPLAMFIHGGWWRTFEPATSSHMARGLNTRGIDVAVVGYDLCPGVSIATIIDQIRNACVALWRTHRKRIMSYGHSAGGHLTACLVATDFSTISPGVPNDLVSVGYAISGLFDLDPMTRISLNADLRLDADEAHRLSPVYWRVPNGHVLDAVAGAEESAEFLRQSRLIADAWRSRGAWTRYEAVAGANHFTVIDPLTDPDSAMTARVAELARRSAALPF